MGSRVMHYCISTLLAEAFGIEDSQFLVGGLAPDVNKPMQTSKSQSHFTITTENGLSTSDYPEFKRKYRKHMNEPFYSGYYYHLISDVIWVRDIYVKKIKWLPQPAKKEAQAQYYRDFWRLNGKLIDHYGLVLQPMSAAPNAVEEIDYRFLPALIKDIETDFELKDEAKDQPLELLDFDEVIAVLETTVQACIADSREE